MTDRTIMFVFPGQGSQYRSMGSDVFQDFAPAQAVYEEASDVLGYDMKSLSFDDPESKLGLTRYTQPALLTHAIACLRAFESQTQSAVSPTIAAGHSLGEYTALVASGCLSLADGLRLVSRRGELMGEHGEGGMVALTVDATTAQSVADKFYCEVATCNLPEQTVVGGRDEDLENLVAFMKAHYPRKRAMPLATEGAFHTYLMVGAAREFRAVLDETQFNEVSLPVLSNYTATPHEQTPESIRTRLFFQLFKPVNWVGCLQAALAEGVDTFVEFGGGLGKADEPAGKRPNLEGIVKKTLKQSGHEATYFGSINTDSINAAAEALAE